MPVDSVKRRRGPGISVRPEAVRRARKESGLSLAQIVAGTSITRQAINLVELGKARPSVEVLRIIAAKTGKPLTYFLGEQLRDDQPTRATRQLQSAIANVHRRLARREFEAAADAAEEILTEGVDDDARAMLHGALAHALTMIRRPEQALHHANRALELYQEIGDPWAVVEALDWKGMALFLQDEPACLPTLTMALEQAETLDPMLPPVLSRILAHIATVHISRHAWPQAVRYYERAVAAAESVRDVAQMARMYDNLSQAYSRLLQPAKALNYANRALHFYEMESDLAGLYRAENNLGDLLLREGAFDAAAAHLERALAGFEELGIDRRGKGYVLVNLGDLAVRRGELDEAEQLLTQALELGATVGERVVQANAHLGLAHVHEHRGAVGRADREFRMSLSILEDLDMPDRLRDVHFDYARSLRDRGDLEEAFSHMERAAEIAKAINLQLLTPLDEPLASVSVG